VTGSAAATISADGNFAVFISGKSHLLPGDENPDKSKQAKFLFLVDLQTMNKTKLEAPICFYPTQEECDKGTPSLFFSSLLFPFLFPLSFPSLFPIPSFLNFSYSILPFLYFIDIYFSFSSVSWQSSVDSSYPTVTRFGDAVAYASTATDLIDSPPTPDVPELASWDYIYIRYPMDELNDIVVTNDGTPALGKDPRIVDDGKFVIYHTFHLNSTTYESLLVRYDTITRETIEITNVYYPQYGYDVTSSYFLACL